MLQLRCFRRKFIWCCWTAGCSLRKEALGLERAQCEPRPWKSSWWPPHRMEANTQRGTWHQGPEWSSGSSVHCSRAIRKGNWTHRAQAGPRGGRCWRSAPAEWGAGNGGTGRAAGMPGRASWWQAIWCTEMVLCHLWLNLSVVCSVIKANRKCVGFLEAS